MLSSTIVIKYNRFGMKQERIMVVTNKKIYNIKKNRTRRACSPSRDPARNPDQHHRRRDQEPRARQVRVRHPRRVRIRLPLQQRPVILRRLTLRRDEIFEVLKRVFYKITKKNLPIFGVVFLIARNHN